MSKTGNNDIPVWAKHFYTKKKRKMQLDVQPLPKKRKIEYDSETEVLNEMYDEYIEQTKCKNDCDSETEVLNEMYDEYIAGIQSKNTEAVHDDMHSKTGNNDEIQNDLNDMNNEVPNLQNIMKEVTTTPSPPKSASKSPSKSPLLTVKDLLQAASKDVQEIFDKKDSILDQATILLKKYQKRVQATSYNNYIHGLLIKLRAVAIKRNKNDDFVLGCEKLEYIFYD